MKFKIKTNKRVLPDIYIKTKTKGPVSLPKRVIHDKNKSENTVIFREKLSKLATLLFSGSRKTSLLKVDASSKNLKLNSFKFLKHFSINLRIRNISKIDTIFNKQLCSIVYIT